MDFAFSEEQELLRRRLPDVLLFGIKLSTVMGVRLSDEGLPRTVVSVAALQVPS